MSRKTFLLAALAVLGAACRDRPVFTPDDGTPGALPPGASPGTPGIPTEHLARLVARALSDPEFRSSLRAELDRSPYVEHKLPFQRLLARGAGRMQASIARANGLASAEVAREAAAVTALEIYMPVPAHRLAWKGDENVLVATAVHERDAPVAFDTRGRRIVLSPDRPPETPVIALVPVETDFDGQPQRLICATCAYDEESWTDGGGEGGGVGGTPGDPVLTSPAPGLYMTKSRFVSDFESWLKGSPEIEVHILGQKGTTDSLMSYQCAGERALGPYYFNQNGTEWSGSVLLFSGTQLASYNAAHPSQNFRVFFVEDDDGACLIKTDKDLLSILFQGLDAAYDGLTAGNDSTGSYKRANAFQRLWAAAASLILTNDDVIGNAVEDVVTGAQYPGYNWVVKGRGNVTNGWVNLEMR